MGQVPWLKWAAEWNNKDNGHREQAILAHYYQRGTVEQCIRWVHSNSVWSLYALWKHKMLLHLHGCNRDNFQIWYWSFVCLCHRFWATGVGRHVGVISYHWRMLYRNRYVILCTFNHSIILFMAWWRGHCKKKTPTCLEYHNIMLSLLRHHAHMRGPKWLVLYSC